MEEDIVKVENARVIDEKIIEESEEKLKKILLKKELWFFLGLIILIILAYYTRTGNISGLRDITTNEYTLGPDLDPFLFLRYAKYIVEHGSLMKYDNMRYVPSGYNTAEETQLLPYMIAYFHKIINIFSNTSVEYSAIIFPVFMFLLTLIAFFLFIGKVFENNKYRYLIAFVATAFLIVSPPLLSRTVAGIPEKESAGFFFLFLGFYLFLSAWKSIKLRNSLILAILAGISTAAMGLIWGGSIYIFLTIAISVFLAFILGKIEKKHIYIYGIWAIISILLIPLLSERFSIMAMLVSTSSGSAFAILLLLIIDSLIFKTKIKNTSFIEKARKKVPDRLVSLVITGIFIVVVASLIFGINFIPGFFKDIIIQLTNPFVERHSLTVAENKQPYFNEWGGNFGPYVKNVAILFWLFFIGSILLFYKTIKKLDKKDRIIITIIYILFLFALIFSRYSPSTLMNGENTMSQLIYFGGVLIFVFVFVYFYYKHYKEGKLDDLKKINFMYLFLLIYFIIGLIGARSAVRLIMGLAPPAVAIVGFFVIEFFNNLKQKNETIKFLMFGLVAILIISSIYAFYFNYKLTVGSTRGMVPSSYTHQWQKAMQWVRENTPENAVFAHWWDYGYWLQTIGKRATIVDGGNAIGYWNYLVGRNVLTGSSEREALEFLYAHNATHLLIDSTDIGKYGAYSSIGSDENYDRYSWIGTFSLNQQATQETKDETIYVYQGGIGLDEDYLWKDGDKEVFFPAGKAGIGALILTTTKDNQFKQPEAVFVYQGNQIRISLRYVYFKGELYDFKQGYEGAIYIIPTAAQEAEGIKINERGVALFLSERNMRALWVRLYLIGQEENFKLVHSEDDFLVAQLKSQGFDNRGFIYYNGIRGPIKIWEINYPEDIEFKEEYLSTIYPESVLLAKSPF